MLVPRNISKGFGWRRKFIHPPGLRWADHSQEHLSALDIDRTASQIMLRLTAISGGEDLKWVLQCAELEQDRREHELLKVN